ncbi:hypothetical protein E4U30_001271 [Claviceps sp. LM220 group G6]|nr:hypothetical protein E4U15_000388 [Claviceps sp. LM218 group G6]KAG6096716.1 hypothetical protein E4U30_001271 [Claviceps sp. LM220 group G6]
MSATRNSRASDMIFMALRALQVVALIILIGLTARHVSYMMVPGKELPKTLAATLALAILMVLYSAITFILFRMGKLRLIIPVIVGEVFCCGCNVIVAALIGIPLRHASCHSLKNTDNKAEFLQVLYQQSGVRQFETMNADRATCIQTKAVWGLLLSLCILFSATSMQSMGLAHRQKHL